MKAMTGNIPAAWPGMPKKEPESSAKAGKSAKDQDESLDAIKQQLADLQEKLSKLK